MQTDLQIKIKDSQGQDLTTFYNFFSFSVNKNLNDKSTASFSVDISDPHLSESVMILGNQVSIFYDKQEIFTGFLSNIKNENTKIYFEALDWLGYLNFCILEDTLNYTEDNLSLQTLSATISTLFTYFDDIYDLPFSLGTNDITDELEFIFAPGESFLSILQKIATVKGEFRLINGLLDYANQTGESKTGLITYSDTYSNIVDWNWEQNLEDFANILVYRKNGNIGVGQDASSIELMGRKFGKFEVHSSSQTSVVPSSLVTMPNIKIDATKLDWQNYEIGDRENVKMDFGEAKSYLNFEFTGIIQSINLELKNSAIQIDITIAEKYKKKSGLTGTVEKMQNQLKDLQINS